jgi:hypothetical protein
MNRDTGSGLTNVVQATAGLALGFMSNAVGPPRLSTIDN